VRGVAKRPPRFASALLFSGGADHCGCILPYPMLNGRPRRRRVRVFELFPVVLAIAVVWSCGAIATAAGAYNSASADTQKYCRTDQARALPRHPLNPTAALPARSGSRVFPA